MQFNIIRNGTFLIEEGLGVTQCSPTSSILIHRGFRMVIDTAHPKDDRRAYVTALQRCGHSPQGVGAVLFTHLHPDHCGHKDVFSRAQFIYHRDEKFAHYFKHDRRLELSGHALLDLSPYGIRHPVYIDYQPSLRQLDNRLYLRHIPGHTRGSIAIFACIQGVVHAWVGGTFLNREYYLRRQPPGCSLDQQRIYAHMDYIQKHADIIIPGHGAPFAVDARMAQQRRTS